MQFKVTLSQFADEVMMMSPYDVHDEGLELIDAEAETPEVWST